MAKIMLFIFDKIENIARKKDKMLDTCIFLYFFSRHNVFKIILCYAYWTIGIVLFRARLEVLFEGTLFDFLKVISQLWSIISERVWVGYFLFNHLARVLLRSVSNRIEFISPNLQMKKIININKNLHIYFLSHSSQEHLF